MPAESTEIWSEQQSSREVTGWLAYRSWMVTGAETDEDAVNATPLDGRKIARINDSHPINAGLLCRSVTVNAGKGRRSRIVRATYSTPPAGQFDPQQPGNPLERPWEIETSWCHFSDEMEEDDGDPAVPIVNSGGFPYLNGPSRDEADIGFVLSRFEPFFPLIKAMQFKNKVNSDRVLIPTLGYVEPFQMLARPMTHDPYKDGAQYVYVHREIWIRQEGWYTRSRDEGYTGYYYKSAGSGPGAVGATPGRFCSSDGTEAIDPVLLDGKGIPIDENKRFVLNPSTDRAEAAVGGSPFNFPAGYLDKGKDDGKTAVFIKFKKGKRIPFATFFK